MTMKCDKCGGTEFFAYQACRGTITVIVDENNNWLRNLHDDFEADSLDFDNPTGPYDCVNCAG